eukprot:PhF_6_TR29194/c0_g1_i1/m.42715
MGCGNSRGGAVVMSPGGGGVDRNPNENGQDQNRNANGQQPRPVVMPKLDVVRAPAPPEPTVEFWLPTQVPIDTQIPKAWPNAHLSRFPALPELSGKVLFATHEIPRVHPNGRDTFHCTDPIYLRAFLPQPLTGYCCGIIRIDFSSDYPHHVANTQTIPPEDSPLSNTHVVNASRYRKYFLYVSQVTELSVMIRVDGGINTGLQTRAIIPLEGDINSTISSQDSTYSCLMRGTSETPQHSSNPLEPVFRNFVAGLMDGMHTLYVEISFRYNNQSFAAWSDREAYCRTGTYQYTDTSRSEIAQSSVIAQGSFQLVVDDCTRRKDTEHT